MSLHHEACRLPTASWKNESTFRHPTEYYGKKLKLPLALTEHFFVCLFQKSVKMQQVCANIWWTTWRCRRYINFSICCNYVVAQLHFCSASFLVLLQIIDRARAWYYIYNLYCIYNLWCYVYSYCVHYQSFICCF